MPDPEDQAADQAPAAEAPPAEAPTHASVGGPTTEQLAQAAEEHPYVPGETTTVGQAEQAADAPAAETEAPPPASE